jgi:hypothetical protein
LTNSDGNREQFNGGEGINHLDLEGSFAFTASGASLRVKECCFGMHACIRSATNKQRSQRYFFERTIAL